MDSILSTAGTIVILFILLFIIIGFVRCIVIVPQQSEYVIQFLGKFSRKLDGGPHLLIPFVESIAYRHSMKEQVLDIPEQICITNDNVQVAVDGVMYFQVIQSDRASYGVNNYREAIIQLSQTNLRSVIGKLVLDRTFEERDRMNELVVREVDKASEAWGVKVLRYEIKNITPPPDVLAKMEKQMTAEREKRAAILQSEGEKEANINIAEGQKQRVIKESEAQQQLQINEAQGQAEAIIAIATATAEGLRRVGEALKGSGGEEAMKLRIAELYLEQFGKLAQKGNTFVLPANLSEVGSMVALASGMIGAKDTASSKTIERG